MSSTKQMMAAASKLGNCKRYLTGAVNFQMLTLEMWKNESVNLRVRVTEQRRVVSVPQ